MNVLVTGGSGFIGAATVTELERRGIHATTGDIAGGSLDVRDWNAVFSTMEGHDAVIHLAGVLGTHELFDTPRTAYEVNVMGTLNVLEACRHFGAGYVGITMPQVFPSIYTATKVAQTRMATAYNHNHGVPVAHVRAFNAYGPNQHHGPGHPQKIIPTFAVQGWRGEPMPVWGDGTQGVDLVHVDDVARMLVDALDYGDDRTFDGGSGVRWSVNEVCHLVARVTGNHQIEYLPMRRGEKPTKIVAEGEGWDVLGWRPRFDFNRLAETVRWYQTHPTVTA